MGEVIQFKPSVGPDPERRPTLLTAQGADMALGPLLEIAAPIDVAGSLPGDQAEFRQFAATLH